MQDLKKKEEAAKGQGTSDSEPGGRLDAWLISSWGWDARRQEGGRGRSRPIAGGGRTGRSRGVAGGGRVSRSRRPAGCRWTWPGGRWTWAGGRECGRVAASEPHTTRTLEQSRAAGLGSWRACPENLYAAYSGAPCLRRTRLYVRESGWAWPISEVGCYLIFLFVIYLFAVFYISVFCIYFIS
jgi:hypothetical protein